MKSTTLVLPVAAAVLFGFAGCAVTSGTTFDSVAGAERSAAGEEPTTAEDFDTDEELPPLRVVTTPDGARVSIDGRRRGVSPLEVEEIEPGRHLLELDRDGYYPVRRWIDVPEAGSLVIELALEPITGFLEIDSVPDDATIYVSGERLRDEFTELRVGTYEVRAERFGFQSEDLEVTIRRDTVTEVVLELEAAPFEIGKMSAFRRRFSPANPGATGSTLISYRVSAPGAGTIRISGSSGDLVLTVEQGPYVTWGQEYRWNGTDESGARVADGTYTVELVARGEDGRTERAETSVTVDSSLVVRYRSLWSSAPGLLYAPDRSALPAGQVQLIGQGAGLITVVDGTLFTRIPARLGLRVGAGRGFEVSGYGGILAQSDPLLDRVNLGGTITWDGASVSTGLVQLGAGVQFGGAYRTGDATGRLAAPDTQGNAPGVFVAIPMSLRTGSFGMLIAPEYRLTFAPVFYGEGAVPENSIGHIGYLRGGFVADIDALVVGASAALRTRRFAEGFALALPFQAGLEAHWIIPESSVALTGFFAAEIGSAIDFYVMSGIGVGVLF